MPYCHEIENNGRLEKHSVCDQLPVEWLHIFTFLWEELHISCIHNLIISIMSIVVYRLYYRYTMTKTSAIVFLLCFALLLKVEKFVSALFRNKYTKIHKFTY